MRALRGFVNILLLLALTFSLACFPVTAEDSVEALIPVSCSGAPCTAVLLDESGQEELDRLPLTPGSTGFFRVAFDRLDDYVFTLKLVDADTDALVFDKTVYRVTVTTYRLDDEKVAYVITASTEENPEIILGDESGKPTELVFDNLPVFEPSCTVSDLRVKKGVTGTPTTPCAFVFALRPADPAFPMPADAVDGVSKVTVQGVGQAIFQPITFHAPGTYDYYVIELSDSTKPYRYDSAIYTIRFVVTEEDGQLKEQRTLLKDNVVLSEDVAQTDFVFQNVYVPSSTPHTGDESGLSLWRGVAMLAFLGLAVVVVLLFILRRKEKQKN